MIYPEKEIKTKDGRTVILRSARVEDAQIMLDYLNGTAVETPYLVNEPEEISMTLEQEERFIAANEENSRALLMAGFLDGEHVGNCSFYMISSKKRFLHRCSLGIALYQKYCGLGIGRQMMETVLEQARACGYEQVELEVVADNKNAIRLYESLGFEICGRTVNGMKYKDGSYADMYMMIKQF